MFNFKKLLVLLLISMSAVLFTGVGTALSGDMPYGLKAGKPYKGTKLVHLVHNAAQAQAHNKRLAEFTALTGIEVEYQMVPFPSLREKITADGVAGTGDIDLYCFLDSWGPSMTGFLTPLNSYQEKDGMVLSDIYPPAYINGTTYAGKNYGLPWRGHPQLLLYRTDLFEQAGVAVPTTWKELVEASKAIKEKTGKDGIAMYYGKGNNGQNLFVWYSFLKSNGAEILDDKMMPVFNSEKGIEATQYYVDLLLKYKAASPGSKAFREYEASQAVAQDNAAMVIVWWWHYGVLTNPEKAKEVVTKHIGFAPVPAWEGRGKATLALSMATGISRHSKNKDAAWEFLKWLSNPDLEKDAVMDKSDPKTKTIVAVHKKNLIDPEINAISGGMHKAAAASLAVSDTLPMIEEWPEVSSVLEIAISNIAAGADTRKEMDKAAKEVRQIMKRSGY
ncbi:MAG: sugar ABC transporter substrate-binding protein [Desulfobacterales bacterium]|nr:sugar ABC transporter substrate-binding protein [Desulfobacterales bacterium]